MIHEWMGSRHRLLREAAGEHMGSCSLRDLDPRGEVEGLAQLPPASGVRVNPHQSTVNKIFQSTGAEYFTELPPSIGPLPLSQRHWPHGALVAEITSGTDRVNWLRNIGPRRSFTFLRQQDRQLEAVRRGMFLSTCVYL